MNASYDGADALSGRLTQFAWLFVYHLVMAEIILVLSDESPGFINNRLSGDTPRFRLHRDMSETKKTVFFTTFSKNRRMFDCTTSSIPSPGLAQSVSTYENDMTSR